MAQLPGPAGTFMELFLERVLGKAAAKRNDSSELAKSDANFSLCGLSLI